MDPKVRPWLRIAGGALVLALVVWWVGTGPFLAGLCVVSAPALLAALAAGLVSTLCFAWRWRRVAAGLAIALPYGAAFAAYMFEASLLVRLVAVLGLISIAAVVYFAIVIATGAVDRAQLLGLVRRRNL